MTIFYSIRAIIPSAATSFLSIAVSTDRGIHFCTVSNNETLSMFSQGSTPTCLFPATSLIYRVQYHAMGTLPKLSFHFDYRSNHSWSAHEIAPIGLNIEGPSYYTREWHFVDPARESGGDLFPSSLELDPVDGYPVQVRPGIDGPAWIYVMDNNPEGAYPAGNYTLISEGIGSLEIHFDPGNHWLSSPCNYTFLVSKPTGAGISVLITASQLNDHVRNVRVIMPGFLTTYHKHPYHPGFLNDTSGFAPIRFMDFSRTNDNNLAYWKDRARPFTAYENSHVNHVYPILSITHFPSGSLFSGRYTALVVLNVTLNGAASPILSTGQQISIAGSDAYVNFTSDIGVVGVQDFNLASWQTNIEVVSPASFLVAFNQYWWNSNYKVVAFHNGSTKGSITLTINPGCALETILDIANTLNASAWLNIPTLADNTFVRNYATMVHQNLKPHLKAYI